MVSDLPKTASHEQHIFAGYEARLYACAIDMLLIGFISVFFRVYQNGFFLLLLQGVYFVFCWYYFKGKTFGNKLMKIRVVSVKESSITLQQASIRFLGFLLSEIVFFVGFLWIFWDKKRRGWHDLLSGTIVIKS